MSPVSPWPALIAIVLALGVASLLARKFGQNSSSGRFASLDGLRGYLGFSVFLHHSVICYFRCHPDEPGDSLPPFYHHLGQSSVSLFFMITGFLFFSKLLDGRHQPFDWLKLYVSRLLRLAPLYFFAIGILFFVVAGLSGFRLREQPSTLLWHAFQWFSFTILGAPDVNGVVHTKRIIWSVVWTLRYEWLFYFSLPLLALCLRVAVPLGYVAASVLFVTGYVFLGAPEMRWLAAFVGGIGAAILVRSERFRCLAADQIVSGIVLGCLVAAFCLMPTGFSMANLALLTLAFVFIAGGSTVFGALVWPASRMLGEMCYSIYLLHGLLLFFVFRSAMSADQAGRLSPIQHWLLVGGCVPVLIACCFFTYRFIEAPSMRRAPAVSAMLYSAGWRWLKAFRLADSTSNGGPAIARSDLAPLRSGKSRNPNSCG